MKEINKELAQQIVDFGQKMFRAGLVTGTGGISALGFRGKCFSHITIWNAL